MVHHRVRIHFVTTPKLTPPRPGPSIAGLGEEARKLATACNKEVSEMCGRKPERHRFFLSLPSFVDVEGCVAEVENAMKLPHKPSGVVIMTTCACA